MRSTSGITCCHFFCSAVFSMPVCRYPIVGAAESTVSPSSSSTRRSTPCVLGCCGPMLTVIVSVRMSGIGLIPASHHQEGHDGHKGLLFTKQNSWLCVLRVHGGVGAPLNSSLHQITDHVQDRPMHFLHARRHVGRHVDVHRRRAAHGAA